MTIQRRSFLGSSFLKQTRSLSDFVSAAESGRSLHQTLIEARSSLSDDARHRDVEASGLETIAYPQPFLVTQSSARSASSLRAAARGRQRETYADVVERDADPIKHGGRAADAQEQAARSRASPRREDKVLFTESVLVAMMLTS